MNPATRPRRRILYVTDGFAPFVIGGMQSYARRQLDALVAAGHEVISISSREQVPPPDDLPWRNLSLPWPGRTRLGALSPWRYAKNLEEFSLAVAAAAAEVRPDMVYSEGPLLHRYLRAASRPAPAVFNPHGLEMFQGKGSLGEDLKSWPLRGIVADHARRADRVVCLSDGGQLMHILRHRIGIPAERIAVVPNAAPDFPGVRPRKRPSGRQRFLFVGRDEPRKGLALLLDAFREIEGAELDIVGTDPPPGGAPAQVRFHGPVRDRGRIRTFYAEADFLVAPSHAEGMPTVILEALAAALPVIATDVGANADPVRDGETGFLIPRAGFEALRRAMRAAMALSGEDYAALSRNCLAAAHGRFSAAHAAEKLLALVDEVTA